MRVARVTMKPCRKLEETYACRYLGFRLANGDKIEHYLEENNGKRIKLRVPCNNCVLGRLLRTSFLVSIPVIVNENGSRRLRFLVVVNGVVRRLLMEYSSQLDEVEIDDARNYYLTPRQAEALKLLSNGANTVSGLSRKLGISKVAASKLIKRGLRKIVKIYT